VSTLGTSYLLVRRGGHLWGVAGAVVEGRNGSGGFRVRSGAATLAVDEILEVAAGLRVHPGGSALARWWPEPLAGLSIHRRLPVVVIDPLRPPRFLCEGAEG
jgi:hypothetical protein